MRKLHRFALAVVASALTPLAGVQAQEAPALLPLPQLIDQSFYQNATEATPGVFSSVQQAGHQSPSPWTGRTANPWNRQAQGASLRMSQPMAEGEESASDNMVESTNDAYGGSCTSCFDDCFSDSCNSCWFGGVYGLGMTRDHENRVWLSYDDSAPTASVLGSGDADMDYQGGYEIRFGRMFCGDNAWEVVYWSIEPSTQQAFGAPGAGALNSTFDFRNLIADGTALGAGAFVNDFYDDAQVHRLRRGYAFQNVELNLLRMPQYNSACNSCNDGLSVRGVVGVRFLKVDEYFQFASDDADTFLGSDNDEIFYDIDVENNLVGAQVGFVADYFLTQNLSLYADTKLGLYNNHITHHSRIGNANGAAVVGPGAVANVGRAFDVRSSTDDVAFLGELRLGANYQLTRNWRLTGGYRAIALTGVALTTNQMPANYEDIDGVANIDSNGSMILHGFQAGVEFNY